MCYHPTFILMPFRGDLRRFHLSRLNAYGSENYLSTTYSVITRSAIARVTGINEKLIGHYASGYRNPRKKQRDKIINGIHAISMELASVV